MKITSKIKRLLHRNEQEPNANDAKERELSRAKRGLFLDIESIGTFGNKSERPINLYKEDAIKHIQCDDYKSAIVCIENILNIVERNRDKKELAPRENVNSLHGIIKKLKEMEKRK